jgi:dihydroneopterin aldolase
MNKSKSLFFGILVAFAVTGCSKDAKVYNEVVKASEEMNKKCPMVIDADTRLDNTAATDNPITLTYNYTAVTVEKKDVDPEVTNIKAAMIKSTQNNIDTSPAMKFYRDNHVNLKYSYKDKNGKFLFDYTITPKETNK